MRIKFWFVHANFLKRDFLLYTWANINFGLQIRNQRWISRRMMYIDIWFMLNLPLFPKFGTSSRLRKYSNSGKFKMNHISIYIIRREIQRWFRIWSQKFVFAYAYERKSCFKNSCGRIQKFWIFLSLPWNSDSKFTHKCGDCIS